MNLHDLLVLSLIMKSVDVSKLQVTSQDGFLIAYGHLKAFIDSYYGALSLNNVSWLSHLIKKLKFTNYAEDQG